MPTLPGPEIETACWSCGTFSKAIGARSRNSSPTSSSMTTTKPTCSPLVSSHRYCYFESINSCHACFYYTERLTNCTRVGGWGCEWGGGGGGNLGRDRLDHSGLSFCLTFPLRRQCRENRQRPMVPTSTCYCAPYRGGSTSV